MTNYEAPKEELWQGRKSSNTLYLHEKVVLVDLQDEPPLNLGNNGLGILGYACDEGVRRNHGRIGSRNGPDAIRREFAKMANHLAVDHSLYDFGNILCNNGDMEQAQQSLSDKITSLRKEDIFCIALGGGHDIAYGHYHGLSRAMDPKAKMGIINFDAHFDLRSNKGANHSGTPFYQIGKECQTEGKPFSYLCLGIREDANDRSLYRTTSVLDVNYLDIERFQVRNLEMISWELEQFIKEVDSIYVTIDLDGFSSAFAPGVSAPSPIGFTPELVLECLKIIIHSKKLEGMDIAEMNPEFDQDGQTAKLAASIMHFAFHRLSLL